MMQSLLSFGKTLGFENSKETSKLETSRTSQMFETPKKR